MTKGLGVESKMNKDTLFFLVISKIVQLGTFFSLTKINNKCNLSALGAGTTMVVPIVKGYVIAAGIKRLNFAGHDFTKYLKDLLSERSDDLQAAGDLDTPSGLEIVREIKEKILDDGKSMLYVAQDFK